jgi:hypothetical protein
MRRSLVFAAALMLPAVAWGAEKGAIDAGELTFSETGPLAFYGSLVVHMAPTGISKCYPLIISAGGQFPDLNGNVSGAALITNADGSYYVDWSKLEAVARDLKPPTSLGQVEINAVINSTLSARDTIKSVSADRAEDIAKAAGAAGMCGDVEQFPWQPFIHMDAKGANK